MTAHTLLRVLFLGGLVILITLDYLYGVPILVYLCWLLLYLLSLMIGASVIRLNFFTRAISHADGRRNQIAITFDDGPHPYSNKILDTLKKYNVKATFFLIGKQIEQHPEIAKRMKDEGHVIANHSYSHKNTFPVFPVNSMVNEIEQTNVLLHKITGVHNPYFRPPFGVTNPTIAKAVRRTGMKVIGWNLRSYDTVTKNSGKVVNRVVSRLKPGAIILLHDNREHTSQILEAILLYAQQNQMDCVTIDEIIN